MYVGIDFDDNSGQITVSHVVVYIPGLSVFTYVCPHYLQSRNHPAGNHAVQAAFDSAYTNYDKHLYFRCSAILELLYAILQII
jgi:hypothetical protein